MIIIKVNDEGDFITNADGIPVNWRIAAVLRELADEFENDTDWEGELQAPPRQMGFSHTDTDLTASWMHQGGWNG